MFRAMRRSRQQLSPEACAAVLERGTSGVLAVLGEEGYPYAVPLSYGYSQGKLYFHCAREGHKLEAIRRCPKVSFCVVDQDQVHPEEYTTYYRSVIAFGEARVLEDEAEKARAIRELSLRYHPAAQPQQLEETIRREWAPLCVVEMDIQHLTGKEAIELVRARQEELPQEETR